MRVGGYDVTYSKFGIWCLQMLKAFLVFLRGIFSLIFGVMMAVVVVLWFPSIMNGIFDTNLWVIKSGGDLINYLIGDNWGDSFESALRFLAGEKALVFVWTITAAKFLAFLYRVLYYAATHTDPKWVVGIVSGVVLAFLIAYLPFLFGGVIEFMAKLLMYFHLDGVPEAEKSEVYKGLVENGIGQFAAWLLMWFVVYQIWKIVAGIYEVIVWWIPSSWKYWWHRVMHHTPHAHESPAQE